MILSCSHWITFFKNFLNNQFLLIIYDKKSILSTLQGDCESDKYEMGSCMQNTWYSTQRPVRSPAVSFSMSSTRSVSALTTTPLGPSSSVTDPSWPCRVNLSHATAFILWTVDTNRILFKRSSSYKGKRELWDPGAPGGLCAEEQVLEEVKSLL